ncbi:MAG: hypothetical protein J6V80_04140 [Clostridia bacterium]|nr:hypothetical protein [Clostridia bacterium]
MKAQKTTREENPVDCAEKDITYSNDADCNEDICKETSQSLDEISSDRTDTETSGEEADGNKKKRIVKGLILLVAAIIIGFIIGYVIVTLAFTGIGGKAKEFKAAEISITLTEGFKQQYVPMFWAVYVSKDVDVTISKDSYADGGYSGFDATQYARYIMQQNGYSDSKVNTEDGLSYFTYSTTNSDGNKYLCYAFAYKESQAYWLVQFRVEKNKADKYADDIMKWAGSVSFE